MSGGRYRSSRHEGDHLERGSAVFPPGRAVRRFGCPWARRGGASGGHRYDTAALAGRARADRASPRSGIPRPRRPLPRTSAAAAHRRAGGLGSRASGPVRNAARPVARDRHRRGGRRRHRADRGPLRARAQRRERLGETAHASGHPRGARGRAADAPRGVRRSQHAPARARDGSVLSFARDSRGRLRPERGPEWDEAELGVVPGLRDLGYRDAYRSLHGYASREPSWTWQRISGHGGGWRLDHLFTSPELRAAGLRYHHAWRERGPQRPLGARGRHRPEGMRNDAWLTATPSPDCAVGSAVPARLPR